MSEQFRREVAAVTEDALGSSRARGRRAHARLPGVPAGAESAGPMRLEIAVLSGPRDLVFLAFVIFPVVMAAYYGFYSGGLRAADQLRRPRRTTSPSCRTARSTQALWHNALIVVLSLVLQGPIALLLALLLNQKMRGQSLIRVLIFVPYVISEVIVGTGWSLMLQTNGAVNGFLESIGLGWLATTGWRTRNSPSGP
jgi:raffinose/stachyose/melibiose transport system permease protein